MKNVQIGNREKIAGLTIACLLTIALVHYFFFMGKAQAYRSAYYRYLRACTQIGMMIDPQQANRIRKFIKDNEAMEAYVTELARDLNVDWEPVFFPEEGEEAVKKRQKRLLELIDQVIDLRKTHRNIRLSFLDWQNGEGWDVPDRLPPGLLAGKIWDYVTKIRETARLMRFVPNLAERNRLRMQYETDLLSLGVDSNRLRAVARHGQLVPLIKRLAHARLIWQQKLDYEKTSGASAPIQKIEEVYTLLEVRLPEDPETLFHSIKQLEFLLRLVDLAEKRGVEEIRVVDLLPVRKVDDIPVEGQKRLLVPEIHFDMQQGRFPSATGLAMRRSWERTRRDMEVRGWTSPRAPVVQPTRQQDMMEPTPTPTPQPVGDWVGDVVPIRITFRASWETNLRFLYELNHNHNPFDIDSLRISTVFGEGGKVETRVTVVPWSVIQGIKPFFAPETTSTVAAASPPGAAPGRRAAVRPGVAGRRPGGPARARPSAPVPRGSRGLP